MPNSASSSTMNPAEGDAEDDDDEAPVPESRGPPGHRHDAQARHVLRACAWSQEEAPDSGREPERQEGEEVAEHDILEEARPVESQKGPDAARGEAHDAADREGEA